MRALHLSHSDLAGGASVAAWRLHEGLRARGVDSQMLVLDKRSSSDQVHALPKSSRVVDRALIRLLAGKVRRGAGYSAAWMPTGALSAIQKLRPDLIHLHWVSHGVISLSEIARLPVPVLWTLHDLWPISRGTHYQGDQTLESSLFGELQFAHKKRVYTSQRIHFIAPSDWMRREAELSGLLGAGNVRTIRNGLDTTRFRPLDEPVSNLRQRLSLPVDRKLILLGAVSIDQDRRKGFDLFLDAMDNYPAAERPGVVVFGNTQPNLGEFETFPMGHIQDEAKIIALYNACDAFVLPSREDNLPNVIAESLACGLPCVGFRTGGVPEMIDHLSTGYLAKPFDAQDLARGIAEVLHGGHVSRSQARARAVARYEIQDRAAEFELIYREATAPHRSRVTHPAQDGLTTPLLR